MSVNPHDDATPYDVRAVPEVVMRSKAGDQFVMRAHCLHNGCAFSVEGKDSDRLANLHSTKAHHPTVSRTELLGVHQRH